jgi:protein involved in polysaccharide export with SLBB domain
MKPTNNTLKKITRTMVLLTISSLIPFTSSAAESAAAVTVSPNYRLTANDMVQIKVFQENDLDAEARVAGDGTINMPLIGSIEVSGKTVEQAADVITRSLRDGYLVDPQVTVNILSYSKRMFTVLGEVQDPGRFEIPDNRDITLLDAIGMAGSYTGIANKKKIILKRRAGGREEIREFNGKDLARGSSAQAVIIQPGDVVTVPESIF